MNRIAEFNSRCGLEVIRSFRLVCLLGVLGLLGITGCGKNAAGGSEDKPDAESSAPVVVEMATPVVQPVEITVGAQGTLSPGQGSSVRVASPFAGRLTAIYVHEGEPVRSGQRLALVDNRPQQAAANSARAALDVAHIQARGSALAAQAAAVDQSAAVRTAQLTLDAALQDRTAQVRQAQNALDAAQTDLAKIRAGARPQEIAQADQTVAQAEATRARAQTELDREQFLFEKGIAAKRQLEDATTALAVANSALTSAQQALSLLRAGARAEDVRAGELRVEGARDMLTQARKSGEARVLQARAALRQAEQSRLQVAVKQQDAAAMQAATVQKQADLAAAQATAAYAELSAPIDGTITRRSANPGDMADPATPFLEISNPNGLNLIASLPAEDGLKVRSGMNVHVSSADVPGRTFPGRVLSVGQVDPQTNLLSVRINVANPGAILRAGTFAMADIVLRQIPHAIVVPKPAVVTQDGSTVVYTVGADGVAHQKKVSVGPEIAGGKQVALLAGLNSGERVVTTGNYELTEGAKTKAAEAVSEEKKEDRTDEKKDAKPDDKAVDNKNNVKNAKADDKKDSRDEIKADRP